jgi:putative restriction endonuclease
MNLHRDVDPHYWGNETLGKAPHKPLLLLCVFDLYAAYPTRTNCIEPTLYLESTFESYWQKVYGVDPDTTFSLPFFHLQTDGFWHLVPHSIESGIDPRARRTPQALRQEVLFAYLDESFHSLLQISQWLSHFRSVIIALHFAPAVHERLLSNTTELHSD